MFQALLTSYYLCNAAAAVTMLDYATVARCVITYQSVKEKFLSEEELAALDADPLGYGVVHGRTAYLRFKEWEGENARQVAERQEEAQAYILGSFAGF